MSVQYAAMASAVGDVRHTADQLDHGRATLHDSFESFLGAGWTGRAAESFRGGWDDWSAGVAEVLGALNTIADLMQQHGQEVQTRDDGVHGSMAVLQARLGPVGGAY